jgi:hypothetical protein
VRRHAESNNLIILAVLLEINQVVALIAVNNKQTIPSYSASLYMPIKVL